MKINIKNYTLDKYLDGEADLLDAHCHLGMFKNANEIAQAVGANPYRCMTFGTTPLAYKGDLALANNHVEVGCGFHPWEITEKSAEMQLEVLKAYINRIDLIGEIGLDFSENYRDTKDIQMRVFKEACESLAKWEGKIVSLHAVKSVDEVISAIEHSGALKKHTFIFHFFNGSEQQLQKALKMGFYFSCGPKMLVLKRGYATIQNIPENRFLIETDLPWERDNLSPQEYFNLLNDFVTQIREARLAV